MTFSLDSLSGTKVCDGDGNPIIVYRGEHGPVDSLTHENWLQYRAASISFGSIKAANEYALSPNDRSDIPVASRVIPAYLIIKNPAFHYQDDPFIDFEQIEAALGWDRAKQIVIELDAYVKSTNNWEENFSGTYLSVEELAKDDPDQLRKLYLDAFPVFDDPVYVGWFKEMGFDGAIHDGNGVTAMEPEYKVFSQDQVIPALSVTKAPSPTFKMAI